MTINKLLFTFCFCTLTIISCRHNENNIYEKPIKELSVGQINYKLYEKTFGTNVSKDGSQLDTSSGYFLIINLGITNKTNQSINFDTSMYRLTSSRGNVFNFSDNQNEILKYIDTSLNQLEILPNTTKHGFIVFNIPSIDNYILEVNNGSWTNKKNSFEIKSLE